MGLALLGSFTQSFVYTKNRHPLLERQMARPAPKPPFLLQQLQHNVNSIKSYHHSLPIKLTQNFIKRRHLVIPTIITNRDEPIENSPSI
ncbi:hypothetical protein MA04_02729 [Alcanivorax balearicus MACL04]|uniref:Uncharacterized protein n=1 Tax=Alloalcanivorax balearicus MACL04 TaxID=1177182 RepID=A0ABT2R112_9GAMM|nr:hypothetical protein [Alloalcanivorax balearicus MACL04]